MQAGKKKMVLDHLVVQQMGKENEEGDIDSILLYGAKELFSGDDSTDINYTSKDVDELIDRVEREAEEEAKATDERERRKEQGETVEGSTKETMAFGFAKIWEAGKKTSVEIDGTTEETLEDQTEAWKVMMESMRKEQERVAAEEEGNRAKRVRNEIIHYGLEGEHDESDLTPSKKKQRKGKMRMEGEDSDADFEMVQAASDVDDEDGVNALVPESIDDLRESPKKLVPAREPNIGGKKWKKKLNLDAHMSKLEQIAAGRPVAHGVAESADVKSTSTHFDAAPDPSLVAGPSSLAASSTTLNPAHSKRPRARPPKSPNVTFDHKKPPVRLRLLPISTLPAGSPPLALSSGLKRIADAQKHAVMLQRGRTILLELYRALRAFSLSEELKDWGAMAIVKLPMLESKYFYAHLARKADACLAVLGQPAYYEVPANAELVAYVFNCKETAFDHRSANHQAISKVVSADIAARRQNMRDSSDFIRDGVLNGVPSGTVAIAHPIDLSSTTPQPAPISGDHSTSTDTQPASAANGTSINLSLGGAEKTVTPFIDGLTIDLPDSSGQLPHVIPTANGKPVTCRYCDGNHRLQQCDKLPSVERLIAAHRVTRNGVNTPELKVSVLFVPRRCQPYVQVQTIAAIQKMLDLHAEMGTSVPKLPAFAETTPAWQPEPPAAVVHAVNGNQSLIRTSPSRLNGKSISTRLPAAYPGPSATTSHAGYRPLFLVLADNSTKQQPHDGSGQPTSSLRPLFNDDLPNGTNPTLLEGKPSFTICGRRPISLFGFARPVKRATACCRMPDLRQYEQSRCCALSRSRLEIIGSDLGVGALAAQLSSL